MAAPFLSTFTLFAEVIITAIILYVFYSGYKFNKFPKYLALFTLIYEFLFDMGYMVSRILTHNTATSHDSGLEITLAAFHGTFSLIMFVLLVIFLVIAWKNYSKGINYFRKHRKITLTFLILWLIAVLSGFTFYAVEYIF